MKQKITVFNNDNLVYEGRIGDLPMKESAIIKKSIELFDDDDPCIIHQSYVIKEYVDILMMLLNGNNGSIEVKNHIDTLFFINLDSLENLIIKLKG